MTDDSHPSPLSACDLRVDYVYVEQSGSLYYLREFGPAPFITVQRVYKGGGMSGRTKRVIYGKDCLFVDSYEFPGAVATKVRPPAERWTTSGREFYLDGAVAFRISADTKSALRPTQLDTLCRTLAHLLNALEK